MMTVQVVAVAANFPGSQILQMDAPATEISPVPQLVQTPAALAPTAAEALPSAQACKWQNTNVQQRGQSAGAAAGSERRSRRRAAETSRKYAEQLVRGVADHRAKSRALRILAG
jgi:hypothetical protein